jgi:hypothetical protein
MAYDAFRNVTVLYGGRWAPGAQTNVMNSNELWEWDGNAWRKIESGAADPLIVAGLVCDPERRKVLRHGGVFSGDVTHDDPATYEWIEADVGVSPAPRSVHAMAYDPKRRRVVLFGGGSPTTPYMNDTWQYGLPPLQLTVSAPQPDGSLKMQWTGEAPPYQLQSRTNVGTGDWQNEGTPTEALSTTVQTDGAAKFFRVRSLFGNAP